MKLYVLPTNVQIAAVLANFESNFGKEERKKATEKEIGMASMYCSAVNWKVKLSNLTCKRI